MKKLLNGLVFGTGFGIAFVTVWVLALYFVFPSVMESRFKSEEIKHIEKSVDTAPLIEKAQKFLGSPAIYSGGFLDNKSGVLSSGPGFITGSVLLNGKPVKGLKIRLALNGGVMSQWADTDSRGVYKVKVPFGEYKIDGYELDQYSANSVLPGKINHPQQVHSSNNFEVAPDNDGYGLNFKFVDPVVKDLSKNKFSVTENVKLEWEAYPKAEKYSVQITEKSDPYTWSNNTLFPWSNKPSVTDPYINLSEYEVQLKPGHFYVFEVSAKDARGNYLSETARLHSGYDFEVTE